MPSSLARFAAVGEARRYGEISLDFSCLALPESSPRVRARREKPTMVYPGCGASPCGCYIPGRGSALACKTHLISPASPLLGRPLPKNGLVRSKRRSEHRSNTANLLGPTPTTCTLRVSPFSEKMGRVPAGSDASQAGRGFSEFGGPCQVVAGRDPCQGRPATIAVALAAIAAFTPHASQSSSLFRV